MDFASDSDLEIFRKTLERLNIPSFNLKMEENPMIEAAATSTNPVETAAMDIPESSNTARFRPRYAPTPTARGIAYVHEAVKTEHDSPMDRLRPEGINPFGIYLDLDCNPDISSTLDRWETSLRLALSVNRMSLEDGKRYIGMAMIKSASQYWQNLRTETKEEALFGDNINDIVTKVIHLLRIEFLGEGYIDRDSPQYAEKYVHALLKLELNDICLLDKYICVFQDYYYHIYGKIGTDTMYLNMFYSKIPDPWGSALIRDYPFVNSDTLGRRISFLKERLSEWCHQAYLIKKAKMIRKENVLCCRGNNLITVIGDLKKPYVPKQKKIKNRFPNRLPFRRPNRFPNRFGRRRFFVRRRPGYFRRNWNNNPITRRTIYRKNPKQAKECRCYACNEIGHYANECPNKFNKKKIEIDEDIEKMIDQEDIIQVRKLEDLDDLQSGDSVYETDSETDYDEDLDYSEEDE